MVDFILPSRFREEEEEEIKKKSNFILPESFKNEVSTIPSVEEEKKIRDLGILPWYPQ